jgi:betaine-aldehyde dehydrogenase
MPGSLRSFVGGRYVESTSDERIETINPATGEVDGSIPASTHHDVDAAYEAASGAFDEWRRSTPAQRQRALARIADEMERRAEEFADLETADTGKPRARLVADEIAQSVDQLRFFAGAARSLEGRAAAEYIEGHTSFIRREPVGVIGQITPWNYPLNMAVWKMAPAIAAGNTVVLKPSASTPATTALFAEIAGAHLPAGVFNVLLGDRRAGSRIVDHARADMVAITGSVRAGVEVARAAADRVTRVHLELGGKAPAVVFADAAPDAVAGIAEAAFYNAGQDCTAATRVLVHESIHDDFVSRLVAHVRDNIRTGDPHDAETFYGPLNSAAALASVSGFIDRLPSHARIAVGGHRVGEAGFFWSPTVLTGVRQDDEVIQQEIFGPVLTVQPFRTEEEALALSNGVPYALAASIWTEDHRVAMRMSRDLDFGCVWINTHLPFVSDMPHGGYKRSGYGKDLSQYGFDDYTRIKHVMSRLEPAA